MTIPDSWAWTTIGEVSAVNPPASTRLPDDRLVSFVPMSAVQAATGRLDPSQTRPWRQVKSGFTRFEEGDILFAKITPSMENGKAALAEGLIGGKGTGSTEFHVLRPTTAIEPKYLLRFLLQPAFRRQARSKMKGVAGQLRVPPEFMREAEIPLAPLAEQRRIVAEIEQQFTRLDAAVAALQRARANLKRYRAALLKAACEGRLVPIEAELAHAEGRRYESGEQLLTRILIERRARWQAELQEKYAKAGKQPPFNWRTKYEEPIGPGMSRLPEIPEGWIWATLPQIGELNRGKSMHRPRNDPRLLGGPYPFIQTGDVRHSRGMVRSHSQTYSEFGLAQSRLWPAGTLCITIAANIAETGILMYPACFPDSVVGFLFTGDQVLVRYAEIFVRTARAELERYAPATAQKNINLDVLSAVGIALPPLAEQRRIVAEVDRRLSIMYELERAIDDGSLRAERLRQAILKQAFEGRLLQQDPNDEPASVMLKRIQAERNAKLLPRGKIRPQGSKPREGEQPALEVALPGRPHLYERPVQEGTVDG